MIMNSHLLGKYPFIIKNKRQWGFRKTLKHYIRVLIEIKIHFFQCRRSKMPMGPCTIAAVAKRMIYNWHQYIPSQVIKFRNKKSKISHKLPITPNVKNQV